VQIGIYGKGMTEVSAKTAQRLLDSRGVKTLPASRNEEADCILVMGGDRGIRSYFHRVLDSNVPVLGISEAESSGFLAQIDLKELPSYVGRLKRGDFAVESVPRVGVRIDGNDAYPILNEVGVFSSKSATLTEHTLRVNGREVWHDSGDGVIISTPIGSSAYSMSAGGPVIFQESPVFGVISVNSLDVTRRPLIVPDSSVIEVDDISSRLHCEAILDGTGRYSVKKIVECSKFEPPARIIRMKQESTAISALAKKAHLAEDLLSMPPSSKLLLKILEYEGALTQKELSAESLLPERTVRHALNHLLLMGYVKRKVSIRDARQRIYEISRIG
jgi:NAD+ kinase